MLIMSMATEAWGQHLVLDLSGCPKERLTDGEHIKQWTKALVTGIEMVAYGEPLLEHFATHDPKTGGYTLVQLIETSNICAHFAENRGEVYIDIFSCKSFDESIAKAICETYFQPTGMKTHSLIRGEARELAAV
jgi:S-adenosylmethionine/arginine decarboxylase-like enzyme